MSRAMKDSGIKWIGVIPAEWKIHQIKNDFQIFSGATPKSEVVENWDGDIIWITPADYKTADKYVSQGKRNISKVGYNSCGTTFVPSGSIIFSKRAPIGTVAITAAELCTNQGCLSCVPKADTSSSYYYYVLSAFTEQFNLFGTGTTFKEISYNDFRSFKVPVPPLEEQQRIADYLDGECARIDNVIEKTRASIVEYKKLKQAIITRAVTKGMRPARPMKDSGIEWLGDIPAEWKIGRVSRFFDIQLGKMLQPEANDANDTLENYLCAANLGGNKLKLDMLRQMWFSTSDKKKFDVRKGDLLVVEGGDVASCDIVNEDIQGVYIQNALHRVRSSTGFDVRLLRYLLIIAKAQGHIDLICNKATIAHFTKEKFASIPFPVPPPDEQKEIANYLDEKTAAIDSLIEKKGRLVTELERLKKSLIFEYVTGKKEALEKA